MGYKYKEVLTPYIKEEPKKEEVGKEYKHTLTDSLQEEFGSLNGSKSILEEYRDEIANAYTDMHTSWKKFEAKGKPTKNQLKKLEEVYKHLTKFKKEFKELVKEII